MDRYDFESNDRNLKVVESKSGEFRANLSQLSINMIHSFENWSSMLIDEIIHMKEQMKFTRKLMTDTEEKPSK
jgi:hypothetical protein